MRKTMEYTSSGRATFTMVDRALPWNSSPESMWLSSSRAVAPNPQMAQPSRERPIFCFRVAPAPTPMMVNTGIIIRPDR